MPRVVAASIAAIWPDLATSDGKHHVRAHLTVNRAGVLE